MFCELTAIRDRWPSIEVLIDPLELELLAELTSGGSSEGDGAVGTIQAGTDLQVGSLSVRPLHTPGHTLGMLSFLVSEPRVSSEHSPGTASLGSSAAVVFTGDTLFKGSVGGVRAPGHTTYMALKDSIMGTLMELPPQTIIYPGHTDNTTVAGEWESNRFIRIWRGLDPEGSSPCLALGEPATLILLGEDYDGGKKAWVRWPDGSDDIVPGSKVQATSL